MKSIHDEGIIHRDLKPENIIIEDSKSLKISIIDFGLACETGETSQINIKCGTPGYIAPEILSDEKASTKSDIFSVGCILFALITME